MPNFLPTQLQHFLDFRTQSPRQLHPTVVLSPVFEHVQPTPDLLRGQIRATQDSSIRMPKITHLSPISTQAIDFAAKTIEKLQCLRADIRFLQQGCGDFELTVARNKNAHDNFGVVVGLSKLCNCETMAPKQAIGERAVEFSVIRCEMFFESSTYLITQ